MGRRAWSWLGALALLALAGAGAGAYILQEKGITPRALAPYLITRTSGHNPTIVNAGQVAARTLLALDRGEGAAGPPPAGFGAQLAAAPGPAAGKTLPVASSDEARRAFAAALPGDVIVFLPGRYRFTANAPAAARAGSEDAPITVRAAQPGAVTIEMDALEGFVVSVPWWRFENLTITGVCQQDAGCEHAFHVVGQGRHFSARNNTVANFNAHFKINGVGNDFPDNGLVESNTITNSAVRRTANPVTPIDLVAASGWTVRRNLIADFIKAEGDRISYGAFAKGGGAHNVFEQNAVLCELRLRGQPGQRIGLSLGGGGTGRPYCRDRRCITEQDASELRSNLVAGCSDAGIYLNRAAGSKVLHNSLVDTAGVQARYPETSVTFDGNLVDGDIVSQNQAVIRAGDNLTTPIAYAYSGYHPLRARYNSPQALDFSWNGEAPRRAAGSAAPLDLCGTARPAAPAYGAIEQFSACLQPFTPAAAPAR